MKRTLGVAVAIALLIIVLAFVWACNAGEPLRSPSPVPSPTLTSNPAPTASSPAPTPTAPIPSSTPIPSPTANQSPTPVSQISPVPVRTPPPGPIDGGRTGATDLRSLGFCDPATPSIPAMRLSWRPSAAGVQLVAIATRPDGFETGRYTVSADLPAGHDQFALSPVEPGGAYYWRVLTGSGAGWITSDVATFSGPTCVNDTP